MWVASLFKNIFHMNIFLKILGESFITSLTKFKKVERMETTMSEFCWQTYPIKFSFELYMYYHMQYTKLPKSLCDEIEKIQRSFLWWDTDQSCRPHLVGWYVYCFPKKDGGLGIKRPNHMNDAFLMKMLWNLITKLDDLWCNVLYSKCGRNNSLRVTINSQPYDSPLWKSLTSIWEQFQKNIVWKLGDSNNINFWLDKWTLSGTNQTIIDTTLCVRDVVTPLRKLGL
jgi:hypothetical protein